MTDIPQGFPESEAAPSSGPDALSDPSAVMYDAPLHSQTDLGTEPHPAAEAPPPQVSSETDGIPEFDPRVRQDFEGLMYLGYLPDEFEWLGHRFEIRSLNMDQILEIGLLHKRYAETLSDVKAYQTLVVAACMVRLDGRALATPLSNAPEDSITLNQWPIVRRWFPPTIDHIYTRYLLLETRVREVIDAIGKASG